MEVKKQKTFTCSSKGFLVTISQIPIIKVQEELEKVLIDIRRKEERLKHKITALAASLEEHVEKGVHLHFAIAFNKRRTIESKYWNFLFDKQANIKPIQWNSKRSKKDSFSYVVKTGDISFKDEGAMDLMRHVERTYTGVELADFVIKLIEEGISLNGLRSHILPEVRTFTCQNRSMLTNAILDQVTLKYEKEQEKLPGIEVKIPDDLCEEHKTILTFLQKMKENKANWPLKKNCLMIISDPDMGKSTFIDQVINNVRAYRFPSANWFTAYKNHFYELIVWEEPNFKIFSKSFLKRLLEGREVDLPIKGSMIFKTDTPLFVINSNDDIKFLFMEAFLTSMQRKHCNKSNDSLCDCKTNEGCLVYREKANFQALLSRVTQVRLKEPIFKLTDLIKPA